MHAGPAASVADPRRHAGGWWLLAALVLTCLIYAPGLSGGFLFDDYPNIVDNTAVQPHHADIPSLVRAALSSPSSEFKRPLASLTFAANYLATGLDPFWMKLTNLAIHLANGVLFFLLGRRLLALAGVDRERAARLAAWIAGAWLVLPINFTGVLYVVQRMESLANLFVLCGLLGYLRGRDLMLASRVRPRAGLALAATSLVLGTAVGVLAKETAVMLPFYAFLIEAVLLRFRRREGGADLRVAGLFVVVLLLPMAAGLAWLLPRILRPEAWATRDFTLGTRLLSEARIVLDYVSWTLAPLPGDLSFYHDDFVPSAGLFHPWTTAASVLGIALLLALAVWLRRRQPLAALGLALFFGCHLLTATVLPLELIYEHRNYFASFGLLLVLVPWLATRTGAGAGPRWSTLAGRVVFGALAGWWVVLTLQTAWSWGEPLRMARELADRAPASPRAQYELGRTYILYSRYDAASPYTQAAYEALERAAALPESSILPQQALIFMNSRMHLPLREDWWTSMIAKLKARPPGVQDESSLVALAQCARQALCNLPQDRMVGAFRAALAHPHPSPRLQATFADYAWNVLDDRPLGLRLMNEAVSGQPNEPAYRITLVRMLISSHRRPDAERQLQALERLNVAGDLDQTLRNLRSSLAGS